MIRKLVLPLMLLTFTITAVVGYAQEKDKRVKVRLTGNQYEIQTPGDPTWKTAGIVVISKSPGLSEDVVIRNYTAGQVTVVNTSSPDGLKPDLNIPGPPPPPPPYPEGSITFTCNGDAGDWIFDVGDNGGAGTEAILTVKVICTVLPSLTPYGIIVLVLLLVASTVWVLRRKRAGVPA